MGKRFRADEISKYVPSLAIQMGRTICLEVPIISLTKIKKDITKFYACCNAHLGLWV